jgi:hypothetical protein
MRFRIQGALICTLLWCGAVHAQATNPVDAIPNDGIASAKSVGQEVQRALKKANATGLSGLRVTEATLKLETGSEVSGDLEINFIIFTIQHKGKKSETTTTELVFSLPKPTSASKANLTDPLAQAISMAAATASEINVLSLNKATITINFAVSKDNSGKISFTLFGAKIGGGVDLTKTSKNTLVLTFSK